MRTRVERKVQGQAAAVFEHTHVVLLCAAVCCVGAMAWREMCALLCVLRADACHVLRAACCVCCGAAAPGLRAMFCGAAAPGLSRALVFTEPELWRPAGRNETDSHTCP